MEYYKNLSLEDLFYIDDDGVIRYEEWRDIPDYEGKYQASSLGRLKSLIKHNGTNERILTQCISRRYYQVNLYLNGKMKTVEVHKLVAITFLNHTPCGMELVVDHIDTDKFNNCSSNLRIVPNRVNTNKKHLKSTSEYTGVSWDKNSNKWKSNININGKRIQLGSFDSEEEASLYYENALKNNTLGLNIEIKRKTYLSSYKGVSWSNRDEIWKSVISINGETKHLGCFINECDAANAREIALENIDKYNGNVKEFRELIKNLL